jgi:hypothetical protein
MNIEGAQPLLGYSDVFSISSRTGRLWLIALAISAFFRDKSYAQ